MTAVLLVTLVALVVVTLSDEPVMASVALPEVEVDAEVLPRMLLEVDEEEVVTPGVALELPVPAVITMERVKVVGVGWPSGPKVDEVVTNVESNVAGKGLMLTMIAVKSDMD